MKLLYIDSVDHWGIVKNMAGLRQLEHHRSFPPCFKSSRAIKFGDLYIHRFGDSMSLWVCMAVDPLVWDPIEQGKTWPVDHKRTLILGAGGAPSWLLRETIKRYQRAGWTIIT